MGKTFKQAPKEDLATTGPMKKSISKLQKLQKVAGKTKQLKKAAQEAHIEENNHNVVAERKLKKKAKKVQEQPAESEMIEEIVDTNQEANVQAQFEEEKVEDNNDFVPTRPSTDLVKVIAPLIESGPIYTGGKIVLSNTDEELYCLCNNEICIYAMDTHVVKRKIVQENEEIANFAVHPSNKSIIYFTRNFLLRYYMIEENTVQRLWKVQNQHLLDLTVDTTGRLLATGATTGIIQVYDLKKGNVTHSFNNNKGPVIKLEFHPQPQKLCLISLCEDYSLRIYDLVINTCIKTFQNFQSSPSYFTVLDDGINVLTSSFDQKINLYDLQQLSHRTSFETVEEIAALENLKVMNPKTKEFQTFLIFGGQSGLLRTLNLSLSEPIIKEHPYIRSEQITKIMKLKKSRKVLVITVEQNILVLSYTVDTQGEIEFVLQNQIMGYNDEVIDIKFRKNKQSKSLMTEDYFAYCTNSSQLRVYYPGEKKTELLWGHEDIVLCLDTYNNLIATGSKDNTIKLWAYESGLFKLVCTFKGHNESVGSINFAPNKGNLIISGSADKTIKLWSISDIKKMAENADVEDITSAKNTILAHDKDINCVKFSPNEKLIASASQDRTIKIFQTNGLKLQKVLKGHKRGVWEVSFSPLEKVLASASGDNTVKIWNLVDGTCMKTLEGHISPVLKVEWLCYGLEIISASADGLLKIWNVKKMQCVNTLEKHEGKLWSLAVRVNQQTGKNEVLSGDNNSTWILWEDQTRESDQIKKQEMSQKVLQEQQLFSLVREKKYMEAGKLSFDLNMTRSFKQVIETLLNKVEFKTFMIYTVEEEGENLENSLIEDGEKKHTYEEFRTLVKYCLEKDMKRLLLVIRDLNTTSKFARVAQRMLEIVLENINFEDMETLKRNYNSQEGDKNLQGFLEVLLSYSERHYARVQKYVTKSFYLDYIMKQSFLISESASANNQDL